MRNNRKRYRRVVALLVVLFAGLLWALALASVATIENNGQAPTDPAGAATHYQRAPESSGQ